MKRESKCSAMTNVSEIMLNIEVVFRDFCGQNKKNKFIYRILRENHNIRAAIQM